MKRLGLLALLVSCGPKAAPSAPDEAPVSNEVEATPEETKVDPHLTDGALWTCQISDYDPQPCVFRRRGDRWLLTKLLGSQRFRGFVTFDGDQAFDFDGIYFCPWGDCETKMKVRFERESQAGYVGQLDEPITVRWNDDDAAQWGGAGYGGLTGEEGR